MSEHNGPQYPQQPQGGPPQGWQPTGPGGWQPPANAPAPGYGPQSYPQQGQQSPPTYPTQGQPPQPYLSHSHPPAAYQPQPGQPQPGYAPPTPAPMPPPAGRNKGRTAMVVTVVAVVVALLAGTGLWYFGFRETKSAGGQDSPQAAVSAILTSLSQKDPVGVADQLDPAEASLFADLNGEFLTELKRLEILSPSASAGSLTGSKVTVTGLTFGSDPDQINDHVTVVKVTGGTVVVATDPSELPLTDKIKTAAGTALAKVEPKSQTYSIADLVAKSGKPIRIATVEHDGKWYPSLFYTAADYWAQSAKVGNPSKADFIAPAGGSSPEDAMTKLLTAATTGNYDGVIALLPPQEMAVMHDYGKLITGQLPSTSKVGLGDVAISNASWNVSDVAGGKLVSLKTLTVTAGGQKVTVAHDAGAGSLTVTVAGQPGITLDKNSIADFVSKSMNSSGSGSGSAMDPQLVKIIGQEFEQLTNVGVVMTEDGGQWYASPMRSYAEIFVGLLKGLQPADVDYLLALARK